MAPIYTYLRLSTPIYTFYLRLIAYLGVNIPFPTLVHELSRYKDAKDTTPRSDSGQAAGPRQIIELN